jgi:hypothetical protein
VTYTLTVNAGVSGFAAPNGIRYKAGDAFTLSDREFGLLTAGAKSLLTAGAGGTSTGSLGGTVSHQVTIASGLSGVVLPNGIAYSAGAVAVLSDEEYSLLTPGAVASLLSANTTTLT